MSEIDFTLSLPSPLHLRPSGQKSSNDRSVGTVTQSLLHFIKTTEDFILLVFVQ